MRKSPAKDSLREIKNGLFANHKRLYHLGKKAVSKSTLLPGYIEKGGS